MLVVRERKAVDPLSPFHGVQDLAPPDCKTLEGYREGHGWKHPRAPSGRCLWKEKSQRLFWFLGGHQSRVHRRQKPLEERLGDVEASTGDSSCIISFVSHFGSERIGCFFLWYFLCLSLSFLLSGGIWGTGERGVLLSSIISI